VVPPDGGRRARVMMVDAWSPQTRLSVDGDAFAFGRFATWLREAIVRGGHDETLRFPATSRKDDPRRIELAVSDWLRFGLPDVGDRFVVDWRAQWNIVAAGAPAELFDGGYGFSAGYLDRLRNYDLAVWRRFLCEVIDPRFGGSG